MTFILTNDDGIDAPGIRALHQAIQQFSQSVMVVAPRDPHSGCGHQVTTHAPIRVEQRSAMEWAIAGTPADCTRLALSQLYPNPQWVLSGINAGGNLGSDVYVSGTVAAVREAALLRIPGIAISHYCQGNRAIDWELAARLTTKVLAQLLTQPIAPGRFWNVNLPHLKADAADPELVFCAPCTQPLPVTYRVEADSFVYAGDYSKRLRDIGGDVEVCFAGKIAVTQLSV